MILRVEQSLCLRIYAIARQAERSLDFALGSQSQWDLLRQYYDPARLARVESVVDSLRRLLPSPDISVHRDRLSWPTLLGYLHRYLVNRFRTLRELIPLEVNFIHRVLVSFLEVLASVIKPSAAVLLELRIDLNAIQHLLLYRLAGDSELRQLDNVEHFCQADHLVPVPLDAVWT